MHVQLRVDAADVQDSLQSDRQMKECGDAAGALSFLLLFRRNKINSVTLCGIVTFFFLSNNITSISSNPIMYLYFHGRPKVSHCSRRSSEEPGVSLVLVLVPELS